MFSKNSHAWFLVAHVGNYHSFQQLVDRRRMPYGPATFFGDGASFPFFT
jgi:hypothetical protein